jgi:hypothetical protein
LKTVKLKNGLILVSVPNKWERFYIDTVKLIGYFENNILGFFNPNILMLPYIKILGTITKDKCSFDCGEYVDILMYAPHNNKVYQDYKDNMGYCLSPFDSLKSMIEAEAEFLFENPLGERPNLSFHTNENNIKEWQQHQSRVIEKLLILKTI